MSAQLPNGKQQFLDPTTGLPLNGGKVYFYIPATTTPKNTYQDQDLTILNTNPVILDAAGQAVIWGDGSFRQILKDALGNTLWDQIVANPAPPTVITSGIYTGTITGGTTAPTVTVKWYRIGDLVTITLPPFPGVGYFVSNAASFTITGGPSASIGTTATKGVTASMAMMDNGGLIYTPKAYVDSSGTIHFDAYLGNDWTNAGNKSYGTPIVGVAAGDGITFSYVVY